jgi:hypothetical protein
MAGALQPLGMMSAMFERHLRKPDPDFAALALKSNQMNTLVREASTHCMDLMSWLAPKPNELIMVATGVEDTAGLLLTELLFKGFTVVNQTQDMQAKLPRSVTQSIFLAALIALTDAAKAPASVVLEAGLGNSELVLTISIHPAEGELEPGAPLSYRTIEWEEVEALADAESVRIARTAERVELHCPLTI